jgi:hypothetical protein
MIGRLGMLSAVDLDSEPERGTIEIESERPDRVLPSKVQAIHLAAPKNVPKLTLRVGHVFAQATRAIRHLNSA